MSNKQPAKASECLEKFLLLPVKQTSAKADTITLRSRYTALKIT